MTRRPTILFLIGTLDSGGVAKSLVSTINAIDRQRYDVHLMVMNGKQGPFSRYLPDDITLHTAQQAANALAGMRGVTAYLRGGHLLLALLSLLRMAVSRVSKSWAGWLMSRLFPRLPEHYDMIVDYNGQQQLYYMVDRLQADKKVTFFHSDYDKWPYYKSMDRRYFPRVDAIFTISQHCVESLQRNFPDVADKVQLFENISSPAVINRLADEAVDCPPLHGNVLITIGHVWRNKGIDLALDAARQLKQQGIDFTWLFIGNIAEPQWVQVAKDYGLECDVLFLGMQPNPYPFIRRADVVVHPSRFEGKSITLDEAKIMCKPIVVTRFSTVGDQFTDGVNASVCDFDGSDIAACITRLLTDDALRQSYIDHLAAHVTDNSSEVQKLYHILEH